MSERTAAKWVGRYRAEGEAGLADRSSTPLESPNRTGEQRVQVITQLRRLRMTAAEIAEVLGMPLSTVSAVLTRVGLGKRSRLERPEPANRYQRGEPGELLHIDVKKLVKIDGAGHRVTGNRRGSAKGIGWEYVHVCVDDATRLAYVEVLEDDKGATAVGFLRRAVAHFAAYGIRVRQLMTDNGPSYRSTVHALACRVLGLKHIRTRPYRPRTNGKAERFIRTLLAEWAYAQAYRTSLARTLALSHYLGYYNTARPHMGIGGQTPQQKLAASVNNLLINNN